MDFDKSTYKVKNWKSFTYLHWIINPGLAFNEIFLGQRIPKKTLIDKTSDKPLMERTYVPCPHCKTLHDSRIWNSKNKTAFKNWFGYYCPECGKIIPCLHNGLAYILMILTYPLWGWFADDLKERWLQKQPQRFQEGNIENITHKEVSWIKMGAQFGGTMFLLFCGFQILLNPSEYLRLLLINIPIWAIGGLTFGYVMKYWMNTKGQEASSS